MGGSLGPGISVSHGAVRRVLPRPFGKAPALFAPWQFVDYGVVLLARRLRIWLAQTRRCVFELLIARSRAASASSRFKINNASVAASRPLLRGSERSSANDPTGRTTHGALTRLLSAAITARVSQRS